MLTHSESLNELAAALTAAQRAMRPVAFDAINPHFKSRYASLAAIVEALREPLAANGLAVSQVLTTDANGQATLDTVLLHTSGQFLAGSYPIKPARGETPQDYGSALTYARRYALAAITGAVADDDDDGNAASRTARTPQEPRKAPVAASSTPRAQKAPPAPTTPPTASQSASASSAQVAAAAFDALPSASADPKIAAVLARNGGHNGNGHKATRPTWHGPVEAQDWAMTTGAFEHRRHCENAYDKLRRAALASENPPANASAFFDLWYADVNRRVAEKQAELDKIAAGDEQPQF